MKELAVSQNDKTFVDTRLHQQHGIDLRLEALEVLEPILKKLRSVALGS